VAFTRNNEQKGVLAMIERSVRNFHYRVGIVIVGFLLLQAITGLLIAAGSLASAGESNWLKILEVIHTNWDPVGSLYRIALGLGTLIQGLLGITIIVMSRGRFKRK
jgi:hypothetical protein